MLAPGSSLHRGFALYQPSGWAGGLELLGARLPPRSEMLCKRNKGLVGVVLDEERTGCGSSVSFSPNFGAFTFHFCALEKEMATHSSVLA